MSRINLAVIYEGEDELHQLYKFLKRPSSHYIEADDCLIFNMHSLTEYDLRHTTSKSYVSNKRIMLTFTQFKQLHFDLSIGLISFDHETISERFIDDKL